jgi:hypothetical protein
MLFDPSGANQGGDGGDDPFRSNCTKFFKSPWFISDTAQNSMPPWFQWMLL